MLFTYRVIMPLQKHNFPMMRSILLKKGKEKALLTLLQYNAQRHLPFRFVTVFLAVVRPFPAFPFFTAFLSVVGLISGFPLRELATFVISGEPLLQENYLSQRDPSQR